MIDGPDASERRLVARCLLTSGTLIGSEDEIWTHASAWRALGTLRMCVAAIRRLHLGSHSVRAPYVKAIVSQESGGSYPFVLDEMADFLMADGEARSYWDGLMPDRDFPHLCPHCRAAAFVGFLQVWCKARCPDSKTR